MLNIKCIKSKSKSINNFTFFILSKPDSIIFLFMKFMDSQAHTPTLRHHLQNEAFLFSETTRSVAVGMTRDVLLINVWIGPFSCPATFGLVCCYCYCLLGTAFPLLVRSRPCHLVFCTDDSKQSMEEGHLCTTFVSYMIFFNL